MVSQMASFSASASRESDTNSMLRAIGVPVVHQKVASKAQMLKALILSSLRACAATASHEREVSQKNCF